MKILAVIPARAGSKGIPNKNIRIIRGYPLIYYSIKNALESQYITDVIVTTDSPEVKIIARQMGVPVRWRKPRLCSDEVTLDSVVYDAIEHIHMWDYVVTLQPTSPTLTVVTLDKAIAYTIANNLDTLISVINDPHLSWSVMDGKKVTNYTERLNRQYLPPCYRETGAFLISKASVITPQTRIGKKVDVYEVPEAESQDVNTFADLCCVAVTMEQRKVAFFVTGNHELGTGHIYRALELADEFYVKPDIYYDSSQTDPKIFGNTKHNLIPVNGVADLFHKCKEQQYSFFINDILDTSNYYMNGLRSVLPNAKIINFEDDGEGAIKADIVFNALYDTEVFPQSKVGEKYYICGKKFLFYKPIEIREQVKCVFISFGGADPQNYTDRLLHMICKQEYKDIKFIVVLGRASNNVEKNMQYNQYANIEVLYDVSSMPELMTCCDMAVTSRGRTCYELAILGVPTIAMAQNKREEKHGFVCNENGFSYIGLNPPDEVIEANLQMYLKLPKVARQHFQELLLSHDLRGGRKRVMRLIRDL